MNKPKKYRRRFTQRVADKYATHVEFLEANREVHFVGGIDIDFEQDSQVRDFIFQSQD